MGTLTAAIALWAVWLVFAGNFQAAESASAAIATACAVIVVRRADPHGRVGEIFALSVGRFARGAAAALGQAAADSGRITAAILRAALGGRRAAGSMIEEPVRRDIGANARSRRAASVTLVSFAPNTVALEADPATRSIRVHSLLRQRR